MNVFQRFFYYFQGNGSYIFAQFIRRFLIFIHGVLFATVVEIPVGTIISRGRRLVNWVARLVNIIQTIPSLAIISVLIIGLGLGVNVIIITVLLYSLLPVIKNTYTEMIQVDESILDVGKGMGTTARQRLFTVELPLSVSVIMAGIRDTLVAAIGIATIGAFVSTGSLEDIIIRGTNTTEGTSIILAGALPTALMAIITDWPLGILERRLDLTGRTSR